MVGSETLGSRKLKSHKKSRAGCGECKFRKVKCDEGKPACKRCRIGRYICKYGGSLPLVEVTVNNIARQKAVDNVTFVLGSINAPGLGTHIFQAQDLELLNKFRSETTMTITTNRNRSLYQNQIIRASGMS